MLQVSSCQKNWPVNDSQQNVNSANTKHQADENCDTNVMHSHSPVVVGGGNGVMVAKLYDKRVVLPQSISQDCRPTVAMNEFLEETRCSAG
ncbi:unnamed protein product [Trichobilharzia regenti]|nr:unnamed protein product [Trichobilharzia regenti]